MGEVTTQPRSSAMSDNISIQLSQDEALVLFEFFARFSDSDEFKLRHTAEYLAFSKISAQLDTELVEPFCSDYVDLLKAAQSRLAAGYEGTAPGVVESS